MKNIGLIEGVTHTKFINKIIIMIPLTLVVFSDGPESGLVGAAEGISGSSKRIENH